MASLTDSPVAVAVVPAVQRTTKTTTPLPPPGENRPAARSGRRTKPGFVGYSDSFEAWWQLYPRKVAKGKAWDAWRISGAAQLNGTTLADALAWQTQSDDWTRNDGQFIPHPSTYLNQRRWEDQPLEKPEVKF